MGPKKGAAPAKVLLGRPSNNLKIGIVGLPNVGKSTLFNTLCEMNVAAANHPFCTIDPNVSRVAVPDERFDFLVEHHKPASRVPAYLHITDIAGLVRGAHEGQGLGNAFLSHIRAVDGIYHVVRIFDNEEITHVEGEVDPVRDLEIISEELRLKDVEGIERKLESMARLARGDKKVKQEYDEIEVLANFLREGKDARDGNWTNPQIELINQLQLLTAKPIIYLVNMSERDFIRKKNKWLPKIKQWVDTNGKAPIIPLCVEMEAEYQALEAEEAKQQFCTEKKFSTVLPKIITVGYHQMHLVHYFTAGPDEVRCWTVREGTKAPDAAGVIHNDFRNGFICAEVMAFNDFKEAGGTSEAKASGKYRQEGKNYVFQDGDIAFFKANAGAGLSKKKK